MAEPDDVERLVAEVEQSQCCHEIGVCQPVSGSGPRLARIVRELLAEHPVGECEMKRFYGPELHPSLVCGSPTAIVEPCAACRNRAMRERLCRIARGEEA